MSDFRKKYFKYCLIGIIIIAVLATLFVLSKENNADTDVAHTNTAAPEAEGEDKIVFNETREIMEEPTQLIPTPSPTPTPAPTPAPIDFTENIHIDTKHENMCTVSVSCAGIDRNSLTRNKQKIIPEDGVILSKTQVNIIEGETAYDILIKILKDKKIPYEKVDNPLTGAYFTSIGNLSERDCGLNSGWIYKINGADATESASKYVVKASDIIEWIYIV